MQPPFGLFESVQPNLLAYFHFRFQQSTVRTSFMNHSIKEFEFHDPSSSDVIKVVIPEVANAAYGLYVWPCAPVLAQYVWENRRQIQGKTILEIGSGTALPGIVAAKCGAHVTLSDGSRFQDCLELCRKSADLNNITNIKVEGISWGTVTPTVNALPRLDVILASDCFYDSKDFEDVVMTLSFLLQRDSGAEVWCSYQDRSSDRSIWPLLSKWGLKGDEMASPNMDCVKTKHAAHSAHVIQLFRLRLDDSSED